MLNILFILVLLTSCTLLFLAILATIFRPQLEIEKRIDVFLGGVIYEKTQKKQSKPSLLSQQFKMFWLKMRNVTEQKISREVKRDLERKLLEAGRPFNWTSVDFRLLQLFLAIGLVTFVFLTIGKSTDKFGSLLLLMVTSGALGLYLPIFYLSKRKQRRVDQIQKGLSDFFDTINLTIEAGVGLDAAIRKVSLNTKGPLSEEFLRALEDVKLGKSRREAFIDLRDRVPLDSFQSIMTSLIQADQLGIGMAKVIRSLTVRIREQQMQLAREKAMKAPVKMLFPMVLFIFPAMFIVLLGPLIIQLLSGVLSL